MIFKEAYKMAEELLRETLESEEFKTWTKGENVIKISASPSQLCVIVLIEDDGEYNLLRFFKIGDRINVSADATNTNHSTIIEYLMEKVSDDKPNLSVTPNVQFDQYGDKIKIGDTVDVGAHGEVHEIINGDVLSIHDTFVEVGNDEGVSYDCDPSEITVII